MKRTLNIIGWTVLVIVVIVSAIAAAIIYNQPQSEASNALKVIDSGETFYYGYIGANIGNPQIFEVLSTAGKPSPLNLDLNENEFFLQIWQENGQGTAEIWAGSQYNEYVINFTDSPCTIHAGNVFFTLGWHNSKILFYEGKLSINSCSGVIG